MTENIAITIDSDLLERLDEYAKKFKRSRIRSLIINRAIQEYLDDHENENRIENILITNEKKEQV